MDISDEILQDYIYIPSTELYVSKERTLHGKSWFESHENGMQNPKEFIEFLKYIKTNCPDIYNDVTKVRSPWRGEWINAYFEQKEDGIYILTANKTKAEKLNEDTLMQDRQISLESWLENPTKQGFPRKDTEKGDLYFLAPRNGSVSKFDVSKEGVLFFCGGIGPSNGYSVLGVRRCIRKSI